MSFVISKNRMEFHADNNEKNLAYSNVEEVYIAHDKQQVIGEVDLSGAGINHFIGMVHLYCPGVAEADMPDCRMTAEWDGNGETTDIQLVNHMEPDSGQSRGGSTFSFKEPLINVQLLILPNQAARNSNQSFTIPANSQVLFSLQPQDAVINQISFTGPSVPVGPPAITHGFTVPVHSGIPDDLEGDYRRFPYSFDKTGTATSSVVGIYEKSDDDGSKITVNITMLYQSNGWDVWSIFKREYEGAEYPAALAIHNAGSGHADYSSGYDFVSDTDWVERTGNQYFRSFNSYSDGSGHCPKLYHTGDIPLTTIQP